jgi:NAD(P)-dependent dehydrogenase (short-subunit alcohol dehydrogenase family)
MSQLKTAKRIALVTGGNKGIGCELSRNLAGAGCIVLLGARDAERGKQAVHQLELAGLTDVYPIEVDVTKHETVRAAAQQIKSHYGRLDILINNAGINVSGDGLASAVDIEVVQRVFETNFFGALRGVQAMLPLLRHSTSGRIVNVSSGLGSLALNSDPSSPSYNTKLIGYNGSKAALNMLTVHLAYELQGTSIKVNSANPGFTKTDLNNNTGVETVQDGALAATRLALLDDAGPTGGSFSKEGPELW